MISVVKRRQQLIAECSVNVKIFIVLSTLFEVLAEDRLLIKGGCTRQDVGSATRVGRADEGDLDDKGVMSLLQDKTEVVVLSPSVGTLDQHHVCGEETKGFLNGRVFRFPWMLGEGWGWKAVGDGVSQLGVRHLVFFSLVSDC